MENTDNLTIQEELKLASVEKSKKVAKRIYEKLNTLCWEETDMSLWDFLKYYTAILEMADPIESQEHELIELRNVNKLSYERITDLENNLSEAEEKIEQLEEAVAKYDFLD